MNGSQQKQRRQKWFGAFGRRRARRTPGRRLAVEPMEGRVLMTADLGGNSFAAATELGTLSGTRQIADFVGSSDVNDYYHIRLAQPGNLRLTLDGLAADADVELLNSSGAPIARSARGGASAESIRQTLDAGTYFVRVYPFGSADTNYRLTLQVESQAPPDGAGNTMNAARDLGTLRGSVTFQDFVRVGTASGRPTAMERGAHGHHRIGQCSRGAGQLDDLFVDHLAVQRSRQQRVRHLRDDVRRTRQERGGVAEVPQRWFGRNVVLPLIDARSVDSAQIAPEPTPASRLGRKVVRFGDPHHRDRLAFSVTADYQ